MQLLMLRHHHAIFLNSDIAEVQRRYDAAGVAICGCTVVQGCCCDAIAPKRTRGAVVVVRAVAFVQRATAPPQGDPSEGGPMKDQPP